MTNQQRRVVGVMVTLIVTGFVFMGIRSNRRKLQQEKLRQLEQIKVESAKRRTKSVVFALVKIKARTEIKKEWIDVKVVEERDLPKQEFCRALDEVVGTFAVKNIYQGDPITYERIVRVSQKNLLKYPDKFIGGNVYDDEQKKARSRAIVIKVFPYDINGARLLCWKFYEVFSLLKGKRTPLVASVRVLWAGKEGKESKSDYVTLEANLSECEKLLLANKKGKLLFKRVNEP